MPEKKPEELLIETVDNSLELLVKTCEDYCKESETKTVPLIVLKEYKKVLIDNFKKGLKL